ncbi:type II secretion system protein G [Limihaloglobus sulfuriphilus]|uniref:Type II secretion system protein G n=1 Tax=Limihaloglobus sulfuriphilus TaxID=1851148 RepID=A0A1Q2MER9_9BACT|nr:type II secretion system protein [Limihaloglobus sulfuriphilus]AQQ71038.1 type II secretion system protein G [Limihaloglobus sulfuriphilus]
MYSSNKNSSKAFTLIELLVVISIIALLMAIMMPALNKARNQARSVVCSAKLRDMNIGYLTYIAEYGDRFPPYELSIGKYWTGLLMPYHGMNPEEANELRTCPSATKTRDYPYTGNYQHKWHGSRGSWLNTEEAEYTGSYGWNAWLNKEGMMYINYVDRFDKPYRSLGYVEHPDKTPTFGDCVWTHALPQTSDPKPDNLTGDLLPGRFNNTATFAMDRHDMAVNIAMVDGSVMHVNIEDIWQLYWHRGFTPRELELPKR